MSYNELLPTSVQWCFELYQYLIGRLGGISRIYRNAKGLLKEYKE